DAEEGHLLVHALSGHLGWVREGAIERCGEERHRERLAAVAGGAAAGAAEAAARRALSQLGTPYLFGGRGDEGIDCSGLVQTAFATEGVFLPRDANQQMLG